MLRRGCVFRASAPLSCLCTGAASSSRQPGSPRAVARPGTQRTAASPPAPRVSCARQPAAVLAAPRDTATAAQLGMRLSGGKVAWPATLWRERLAGCTLGDAPGRGLGPRLFHPSWVTLPAWSHRRLHPHPPTMHPLLPSPSLLRVVISVVWLRRLAVQRRDGPGGAAVAAGPAGPACGRCGSSSSGGGCASLPCCPLCRRQAGAAWPPAWHGIG